MTFDELVAKVRASGRAVAEQELCDAKRRANDFYGTYLEWHPVAFEPSPAAVDKFLSEAEDEAEARLYRKLEALAFCA